MVHCALEVQYLSFLGAFLYATTLDDTIKLKASVFPYRGDSLDIEAT